MEQNQSDQKEIQVPSKELLTVLGIIQLVNSRGGFKPEEFVDVGNVYAKLYKFLVDINVIQKTEPEKTTANSAE